jgi:hypothetical protein
LASYNIPLFNALGFEIGRIPIEKAISLHGSQLELRTKGTGRRRRFTSAKLFPVVSQLWIPKESGGFIVLQLITR